MYFIQLYTFIRNSIYVVLKHDD